MLVNQLVVDVRSSLEVIRIWPEASISRGSLAVGSSPWLMNLRNPRTQMFRRNSHGRAWRSKRRSAEHSRLDLKPS